MVGWPAAAHVQLARSALPRPGLQNAPSLTTRVRNALVWRAEMNPDAETAGQLT